LGPSGPLCSSDNYLQGRPERVDLFAFFAMTKATGREEESFSDLLFSFLKSFSQQYENQVFPRAKLFF